MITFLPLLEWMRGADRPRSLKGLMAESIPLYRGALADCERVRGTDHPSTLRARNNLAMAYRAAGRTAEAIPLLERALDGCERVLGDRHPDTRATRSNLALAYRAAGRTAEAVALRSRVLPGWRQAAMRAAVRQARAMMVRTGLAPPLVTWRLASAT